MVIISNNNINNAFKTNNFQDLKSHIIICEDVLENPLLVREYALQKYNHCIKKLYGNVYPNAILSSDFAQLYSKLLKMNVYIKGSQFLFIHRLLKSYPHSDSNYISHDQLAIDSSFDFNNTYNELHCASVIYLNPIINNFNATNFFEDCNGNATATATNRYISSFSGNRFNKLILYDGTIVHAPGSGFGNDNDPDHMRLGTSVFMYAYSAKHGQQS